MATAVIAPVASTADDGKLRRSAMSRKYANRAMQTRITTKYKVPNLDSPKYQSTKKRKRQEGETENNDSTAPSVPRAALVLKTFDHESGACLKFKTDRAADVGRLVNGLGRMGRHMAALPEKPEVADTPMNDAPAVQTQSEASTKESAPSATGGGAGGGGKKKKKGKK